MYKHTMVASMSLSFFKGRGDEGKGDEGEGKERGLMLNCSKSQD